MTIKLTLTEKDLQELNYEKHNPDLWLAKDPTCYEVLNIVKKEKEVTASGLRDDHDIPDRTAGQALERLKKRGYVTDTYGKKKSKDGTCRLRHFYSLKKDKKTFKTE